MPPADFIGGQRADFDIPELWSYERLETISCVLTGLSVAVEERQIVIHCGRNSNRAALAHRGVRSFDHPRASMVLRLSVAQDFHPVRVGIVVGDADLFDLIGSAAGVVTRDPLSR